MPAAWKAERGWVAECMGLACAVWGWSPGQFWKATPSDMAIILKGLRQLQGQDFDEEDVNELRKPLKTELKFPSP